MPNDKQPVFSWSNYLKPTPINLQYFAASIRGLFVLITGTSIVTEAGWKVSLACLVTGYLLDELTKFFARAADDYQHQVVVTETTEVKQTTTISTEAKPPADEQTGNT